MTQVLIDIRRPAQDGVDVPANGTLEWKPTRRRNVDDYVVLPDKFAVKLSDGTGTPDVAPTTDQWVWKVTERINAGGGERFYEVPDSETPVNFTDLVELNPESLEPISDYPTIAESLADKADAADVYDKAASDARYATTAQGAAADSAVQPGDLADKADELGLAAVVPLRAYGHSGLIDVAETQVLGYWNRARKRLGSISWNNLAVGGRMAVDTCAYAYGTGTALRQGTADTYAAATTAAGTWTPSAMPLGVVVVDTIGNDAFRDGTTSAGGTTAKSRSGAEIALDALIRLLRAQSKREDSDASITYTGTWTSQATTTASGGTAKYATVPGAKATFTARNGDTLVTTAFDQGALSLSSAAWTLTCDGQPYKSGTTNNTTRKSPTGNGASQYAIPIEGLTDGDHTFVFTHAGTSGHYLYVDCILRESPTPPTIILVKTGGATAAGYAVFGGGAGPAVDLVYDGIIDTVAARFPDDGSVIVLDPKACGYDPDLHAGSDGIHATDEGAHLLAMQMLVPAINALTPRPGLTR